MRQLLLDTHVALWALGDPGRLAPQVREAIEDPRNAVAVSSASVWEVEIKRSLGKLDSPAGFAQRCVDVGFDPLPITFEHAESAASQPPHHGDPFDRMLVAQAVLEGFELVSDDRMLDHYGIRVIRASA